MSQERLNRLVILSIESELLEHLEYKNIISNFVTKKCKNNKIKFLNTNYNFFLIKSLSKIYLKPLIY